MDEDFISLVVKPNVSRGLNCRFGAKYDFIEGRQPPDIDGEYGQGTHLRTVPTTRKGPMTCWRLKDWVFGAPYRLRVAQAD